MKEFFIEIFGYHHYFNGLLIEQLALHETALPQRTYPLFCHVLNASQVWNSRILGLPPLGVHQVHTFSDCTHVNNDIMQGVSSIVEHRDLSETIDYVNTAGKAFSNTIRDILFHSANHATHHKGQIIADFRLSGIEPLVTDYIMYKRAQGSNS